MGNPINPTDQELVRRFGSPSVVLQATRDQLRQTPRVGEQLASALVDAASSAEADGVLETDPPYGA